MSMTEKNHSAENALAERVNGILKQEYWLDANFAIRQQARQATAHGIRMYNTRRPHTALKFATPEQVTPADQNGMLCPLPSAPFRFATLTSTARWGGGKDTRNNQHQKQSTKFISGLDPVQGVLSSPFCFQPLCHLGVAHEIVGRETIRLPDENDAPASTDPSFIRAPAKLAQAKPAVPVGVPKVPRYPRELFFNLGSV